MRKGYSVKDLKILKIVHRIDESKIYFKDISSDKIKKVLVLKSLFCFENIVNEFYLDCILITSSKIGSYGVLICQSYNLNTEEYIEIIIFSKSDALVFRGVSKGFNFRDYNENID